MRICLINASNPNGPQGNDSYTDFRQYSSWSDAKWRSWHSIPCALKTEFFAYNGDNFHRSYQYDGVIILVNHEPHKVMPLIKKFKMMKKKVCVGYHEGSGDFFLKSSQDFGWLNAFMQTCNEADFYLNIIPSSTDFFKGILSVPVMNIVHGAPYHEWKHRLTKPADKRKGILLATRTFDQRIRRNTLASLGMLNSLCLEMKDMPITVVGETFDHIPFQMKNMKFIKAPMPYLDWLDLISKHEMVCHMDESNTLGQVVTDAALVEVDCVGGNSYNNIMCNTNTHMGNFLTKIKEVFEYPGYYGKIIDKTNFSKIAKYAKNCFSSCGSNR